MNSIKLFLILITISIIILVTSIAAIKGYRNGLESTERLLDQQLEEKAQLLHDTSFNGFHPRTDNSTNSLPFLYQIIDIHGDIISRSPNAPETPLLDKAHDFSIVNFDQALWRGFSMPSHNDNWIFVAEDMKGRYQIAESITLQVVTPILMGLPILAILVWLAIRQGLAPLHNLTAEVKRRRQDDLSTINIRSMPVELSPLTRAMNGLLIRLNDSFEREKRFSADVAHELRTPLSTMKVSLFNLKKQVNEEIAEISPMEKSIERMRNLIEQLLLLYRMSSEEAKASFKIVNLGEEVRDMLGHEYPLFADKQQELELNAQDVRIRINSFAIRSMLKNLLDNARKYTPEHGSILVEIEKTSDGIVISVEDSGPGIQEDKQEKAFERFVRVGADGQNTNIHGSGIGLSIVKHVVDLHGGSVSLMPSRFDTGLKVQVTLPASLLETHI